MALTKDPVLAIWAAMDLLAEAQSCCATIEMSEMLGETEQILFRILLQLVSNLGNIKYPAQLRLVSSSIDL